MKKYDVGFAVAGSMMSIFFIFLVNFLTSPNYYWFIYPCFALLFWPVSVYSMKKRKHVQLAYLHSIIIIAFLIIENYLKTPDYPWFLYAVFPILWWPILASLGKRAKSLSVALIGSSSIIIYYIVLNVLLAPGFPWVIFPAFAVLWWPLSIYHAQRKTFKTFSVHASLLIIVFFITVNVITTPNEIWAVYPIFGTLWWPLSMYHFAR
ncbi:hypothetical protein KO561_04520 [Radiobacillus kanasensis]|uniref:hypothetical protein n=1 Tax=Radiobacillus kanasensis TaxID=2844358 RepID=UPI001E51FDF9|nr:hypothetical protein [Radiobacillus kanasensis]UFU00221.1 hypothetical protein KO561_04520 [Radiobacillus kanasensis]